MVSVESDETLKMLERELFDVHEGQPNLVEAA